MLKRIWEYLKEVKEELIKTNWLTRKETVRYTIIVIILSLILTIFLGGFDLLINYILNKFLIS